MRLSLKEALALREPDRTEGGALAPSGIPVELMLRSAGTIEQPVDLVRRLKTFGLDLGEAHDVVDRVAAGADVAVTLYLTPDGHSPFVLQDFGVIVLSANDRRISLAETAMIPKDVLLAIETWRLSQPKQLERGDVIGLILREWLSTHGWNSVSELTEVVRLYQTI